MGFQNEGPTCLKIGDMMRYGRETIARWPKFYREDLGADIQKTMREMLRLATKARLKYYSKTTLQELDTEKEILKMLLREANATQITVKGGGKRTLLSDRSYGVWSGQVVEIGRLIGGWIQAAGGGKPLKN